MSTAQRTICPVTTRTLVQVITAEFEGVYRRELDDFLGERSDEGHAAWVTAIVEGALGKRVVFGLFAEKSVGAVFGVELEDGDRVVLKVFSPRFSRAELSAMERIRQHVLTRGFPAIRARTELFQSEPGGMWAAIYDYVECPIVDAHQLEVRAELARTLAQLSGILEHVDPDGLPVSPTIGAALWPPSHRSYVDNTTLRPETAWIDARGRAAQAIVRAAGLPLMPAYLDWGVTNVRTRDARLVAVLDWDSLHAASEADLVGRNAAIFTAHWTSRWRLTPTRDEARAFVQEYEVARGRRFDAAERRVVAASADYVIAQIARLSYAPGTQGRNTYVDLLREWTAEPLIA